MIIAPNYLITLILNPDAPKEKTNDKAATTTDENNPALPPPTNNDEHTLVPPPILPEPPNVDCNTNPDVVRCPTPPEANPPANEPQTSLPRCDGSFQDCVTKFGDICKAGQGGHECECAEDMSDCPNHPSVIPNTITPQVKSNKPDRSCTFFPEQEKCKPDPVTHQCPPGFSLNEGEHCFPSGKCPDGFGKADDDETGSCIPKNSHIILICPPDVSPNNSKHCVDHCPRGTHPNHSICVQNKVIIKKKVIVVVHEHITNNNNPNSMVTRNTKITEQLTVGQAIDGCKDLTKKSLDNALKKSCNIMMAATFNYCMTHTKLWLTDSNICSDNLYLKNVQRYIAENVNLKLFPATIYNIRP